MTSDSISDKEQRAAEYVLGTLPATERSAVQQQRLADAELDALINAWEDRLSPLLEQLSEAEPRAAVLDAIQAELDALTPTPTLPATTARQQSSLLADLERRVRRWQWGTAAGFAAAMLSLMLWFGQSPVPPEPFVAVFQQDDQQPAFLMSVDMATRELKVQAISATGVPGRTYQLWIKADPLGPTPQSLGLVDSIQQPTRKQLSQFDPELLKHATFGISVEPPGGSPTGQPTGPAIHGYLYSAGLGI